jgi:hypothetical protein
MERKLKQCNLLEETKQIIDTDKGSKFYGGVCSI